MDKKLAYVEFIFDEGAKAAFQELIKKLVLPEQFYYSDVISRISGDVTNKLHFTLFYGLNESELKNSDLKKLIASFNIQELKLKKLVLFNGYQDLYKILCVEVDDSDKTLLNLSRKMFEFDHDEDMENREFKPHITLAYVKPEFIVPIEYELDIKEIAVKKVQLSI